MKMFENKKDFFNVSTLLLLAIFVIVIFIMVKIWKI